MKNYQYPHNLDCVWPATDLNGNVGAFITAGVGPIPCAAFNLGPTVDDLEGELLKLPSMGASILLLRVPVADSFEALAQRGLYVFDWQDAHRSRAELRNGYELVARPTVPIKATRLPVEFAWLAKAPVLEINFEESPLVVHEFLHPYLLS